MSQTNESSAKSVIMVIEAVHLKRGIDPIMDKFKALKLGKDGLLIKRD